MINLYLPGYSARNRSELEVFQKVFSAAGSKLLTHQWRHWQQEDQTFDYAVELELINNKLQFKPDLQAAFIAKSIGTYMVMRVLEKFQLAAQVVVLLGIPVKDVAEDRDLYLQQLAKLDVPVFVIQNDQDPRGSVDELKDFLADSKYTLIVKQAANHDYGSFEVAGQVIDLLNQAKQPSGIVS